MNDQNQPMDFNPGPTPTQPKNNRTMIIVIVVVVVLCLCCVVVGGGYYLWTNGDKLIQNGTSALLQLL